MSTDLEKSKTEVISAKLNESVLSVLGADNVIGFEKSYQIAIAISFLRENLTDDYMKPIMAMQGSRLGFKTDKDKNGGYPIQVVRDCLIDAVLTGVQPYGNQFNIIANNMYVTKEGYAHLLSKVKNLRYSITPMLPRINTEKGSGAVEMVIKWNHGGIQKEEKVDFAIKVNNFMGTDGVIGKATRKARAWLFNQVSDIEITDGDIDDIDYVEVKKTAINQNAKELLQFQQTLEVIFSIEELDDLEADNTFTEEETELLKAKRESLKTKK